MKDLISAIQFLTVLPFGKQEIFTAERVTPYFPVVGLLLGVILSIFDQAAIRIFSVHVASLLDTVLLIVLTGALHIDGLGDAADGLFSHRPREQILDIMKDSRIGVMGLVAILCITALKWACVSDLAFQRSLALIVIPGLSRTGMMFGIRFLPYGRPAGGTGADFFRHELSPGDFWALSLPVLLSLFLGLRGLLLLGVAAAVTTGVLLFYKKRLGCITGDMLGALTEILETALFLAVIAGGAA